MDHGFGHLAEGFRKLGEASEKVVEGAEKAIDTLENVGEGAEALQKAGETISTTAESKSFFKKGLRKFAEKYKEFEEKYPRVKKVMDVALSRTTGRALMIAGAGITFALAAAGTGGLIFPAIALGGTIAAVATGIGFQVHTLRNLRKLKETEKLLNEQQESIKNNQEFIKNKGIDTIKLKNIAEEHGNKEITSLIEKLIGEEDKGASKASKNDQTINEPTWLRSGAKTVRGNVAENTLAIGLNIVAFNPIGLGISIAGSVLGNAASTVVKRAQDEEKTELKKKVDNLNKEVPGYDSKEELEQKSRQAKILEEAKKLFNERVSKDPEDIIRAIHDASKMIPPISRPNPVVQLFKDVLTVLNPLAKKVESPIVVVGIEGENDKNKQDLNKSKDSVEKGKDKQGDIKAQKQNKQQAVPGDLHPNNTPNVPHGAKKKSISPNL
jgi:hypothetical protein